MNWTSFKCEEFWMWKKKHLITLKWKWPRRRYRAIDILLVAHVPHGFLQNQSTFSFEVSINTLEIPVSTMRFVWLLVDIDGTNSNVVGMKHKCKALLVMCLTFEWWFWLVNETQHEMDMIEAQPLSTEQHLIEHNGRTWEDTQHLTITDHQRHFVIASGILSFALKLLSQYLLGVSFRHDVSFYIESYGFNIR